MHRVLSGKELTNDASFELEKRRNRPVRYDRELYVKVVQGMKKVMKIQAARRERFQRERLAKLRGLHTRIAKERIENHRNLLFGFQPIPALRKKTAVADEVQAGEAIAHQRQKLKSSALLMAAADDMTTIRKTAGKVHRRQDAAMENVVTEKEEEQPIALKRRKIGKRVKKGIDSDGDAIMD
eukprot:CAMPEP_0113849766 /NCGR_PEP_ID=MMETSP0372-20130328/3373_1 /TAXON_ID=340204 /ORGANISM="Lankesteria abbotti" /LENGTH=181 /DNA_ID=CAMNT_0000819713 /DNA_START=77 /DNA_END=622 /DNA_ORIENTATION=+ /assembly_acc=CAM_ASM_000359